MIFNVQHFSAHDGPGVRTTVFFKGCNLRCYWCHNRSLGKKTPNSVFSQQLYWVWQVLVCLPEGCGWKNSAVYRELPQVWGLRERMLRPGTPGVWLYEVCGRIDERNTATLPFINVPRWRDFFGGEPLLQSEYLSEVIAQCKSLGIHTAIESAVCVPWENIQRCLPDLFFCDIKAMDSKKHKAATGQENGLILENIRRISGETEIEMILRTPVIRSLMIMRRNGGHSTVCGVSAASACSRIASVSRILRWKYESFHMDYKAKELKEPAPEKMETLKRIFIQNGCQIKDNKI